MGSLARSCLAIVFLLAILPSVATAAPKTDPLPTFADLQKLYDSGQYPTLLRNLQLVLQLSNPSAQGYDKVELLMLRGETLLQIKNQESALTAFEEAAKESVSQEPKEKGAPPPPHYSKAQIALSRATALLVRRSVRLSFTPKTNPAGGLPQPISLLDRSKREDAFKALLIDLNAELSPKIDIAAKGTTMPPIVEVVQGLSDMWAVEWTTTKAAKETEQMLADVSGTAIKLMSSEVKRDAKSIDSISATAHKIFKLVEVDQYGDVRGTFQNYRGLHPDESEKLSSMEQVLEQIIYTCQDFERISPPDATKDFATIKSDALTAGKKAEKTRTDKYFN